MLPKVFVTPRKVREYIGARERTSAPPRNRRASSAAISRFLAMPQHGIVAHESRHLVSRDSLDAAVPLAVDARDLAVTALEAG